MTLTSKDPGEPRFVALVMAAVADPNSVDLAELTIAAHRFLILAEGTEDPFLQAMHSVALAAFELGMLGTVEAHQNLVVAKRVASMTSALFKH